MFVMVLSVPVRHYSTPSYFKPVSSCRSVVSLFIVMYQVCYNNV